ncbi:hypothetical protein [Microbacterium allomyrinae]|uniref:Uncharacterized protein n=1 Tax=Microbacterium allomyrinae TaxID=2830666 RepID=A0A9X1S2Y8_9MICO|nr:hypothetical protein [Microbacterium allomyrinae]MCC2031438.1 hypothetical protein [Microbacterium allomyrinae]
MSGKTVFTPDEWRIVGGLPYYAAAFVVASGPHHSANTIRNMLTGANEFAHGAATGNRLITDARADSTGPNGDPGSTKNTDENIQRLRGLIEQAARLIDEKSATDGSGFKAEVLRVATAAAAASKDGILGTAGTAVNEHESAALAELAGMLGRSPSASG